jgi:phosphoribosyl 1,2-cyclic phosphodiesterase
MKLHILGSSSAGNAYLLNAGNELLLVECGVRFKEVEKAANFALKDIKGVIVSHEHGDHAKSIKKCQKYRIPIYASLGTLKACGVTGNAMKGLQIYKIGGFTVRPFGVVHDAAEPFGFLIYHADMGSLLFATDTPYLPYKFAGLNHIMMECNYTKSILNANVKSGRIGTVLRNRTVASHMSLETCLETLAVNDLTRVSNIILIHLSDANSDAAVFRDAVARRTAIATTIAVPGVTINLSNKPNF